MVESCANGAVLGVDVGFSPKRRSSAVCRLDWTETSASWNIERFRYENFDRRAVLSQVAGGRTLLAAAFDGPLSLGLDIIGRYRTAERLLTRGFAKKSENLDRRVLQLE